MRKRHSRILIAVARVAMLLVVIAVTKGCYTEWWFRRNPRLIRVTNTYGAYFDCLSPRWSIDGRLFYVAGEVPGDMGDLRAVMSDGSHDTLVRGGLFADLDLSPGGESVALASWRHWITILDLATGDTTRITTTGPATSVRYVRRGSRLIYLAARQEGLQAGFYSIGTDGTKDTLLLPSGRCSGFGCEVLRRYRGWFRRAV